MGRTERTTLVAVRWVHLRRLTDEFGLIQFSRGRWPDRSSGYTADDNARGLVVAARTGQVELSRIYLDFLYRSLRPDGWFHNLWGSDRRPLPCGVSEDCQGRCMWALGEVLASSLPDSLRQAARALFERALPTVRSLRTCRGRANALAGLVAGGAWDAAKEVGQALCRQLREAPEDWPWPEPVLTYELGRVPMALLRAAHLRTAWADAALRTLDFLLEVMIEEGVVVPVGNRGWYPRGGRKARWDQQPVDPGALVEACMEAWRWTGDLRYREAALRAWEWFLGANLLGVPLVDGDGACRDGLGPDGPNENCGAEACLAYLLAAVSLQA
ncbi:MAG: glycosyl transferase [Armatimonadota bacterium]|nr:glycosyl transferase [Armatimonadota bacterium]MDR7567655.1 glycosyl transferase [Armatimonadota bacterium]MDR7600925.1 glycosyl transferase [Armatimonadota bacterium]